MSFIILRNIIVKQIHHSIVFRIYTRKLNFSRYKSFSVKFGYIQARGHCLLFVIYLKPLSWSHGRQRTKGESRNLIKIIKMTNLVIPRSTPLKSYTTPTDITSTSKTTKSISVWYSVHSAQLFFSSSTYILCFVFQTRSPQKKSNKIWKRKFYCSRMWICIHFPFSIVNPWFVFLFIQNKTKQKKKQKKIHLRPKEMFYLNFDFFSSLYQTGKWKMKTFLPIWYSIVYPVQTVSLLTLFYIYIVLLSGIFWPIVVLVSFKPFFISNHNINTVDVTVVSVSQPRYNGFCSFRSFFVFVAVLRECLLYIHKF